MNIYDIAKEANVSIATVSRVMNKKPNISDRTRARVQAVLEKYNYAPSSIARGLASSTMGMVGLVMLDIRNTHYTTTAYMVEQELRRRGLCCIFCNTDDPDPTEAFKMLRDFRVDGIILIGSVFMNDATREAMERYHPDTRIVYVNGNIQRDNVKCILCDERRGAELMVEHMVSRGRRRILFVRDVDTDSARRKQEGYEAAMERLGLKNHICSIPTDVSGFDGGYRATCDLLEKEWEFDAAIYTEDVVALGGIRALKEKRVAIPEEVAVGGFNNAWVGKLTVDTLTSVDSQLELLGNVAAKTICSLMEGEEQPPLTILPSKLFIGSTT